MCRILEEVCAEGYAEGLAEGRKEIQTQAVYYMLQRSGCELTEIADISGLPLEEVRRLAQELSQP